MKIFNRKGWHNTPPPPKKKKKKKKKEKKKKKKVGNSVKYRFLFGMLEGFLYIVFSYTIRLLKTIQKILTTGQNIIIAHPNFPLSGLEPMCTNLYGSSVMHITGPNLLPGNHHLVIKNPSPAFIKLW